MDKEMEKKEKKCGEVVQKPQKKEGGKNRSQEEE